MHDRAVCAVLLADIHSQTRAPLVPRFDRQKRGMGDMPLTLRVERISVYARGVGRGVNAPARLPPRSCVGTGEDGSRTDAHTRSTIVDQEREPAL